MTKDQTWVTQHFEELVSKYGGKFVAIVNKTVVAVGESPKEVYEKAQAQFPNATPSILPVPKEEELTCILKISLFPPQRDKSSYYPC